MPRGRPPSPSSTANRIDLVSPAPQPVSTVPDQGYGVAADQQEAQRIAPMSGGGTAAPPGGPPQGAPGGPDLMAAAMGHNGPGAGVGLDQPTARPNEPVTHGLPGGPGAGPEALTGVGGAARENAVEQGTLKNLLTNLSAQPGAYSAVKTLAAVAGAGNQ